jgi:hypothetical protein
VAPELAGDFGADRGVCRVTEVYAATLIRDPHAVLGGAIMPELTKVRRVYDR